MGKSEPRVTADALKRKREREQEIVSQMIALYSGAEPDLADSCEV